MSVDLQAVVEKAKIERPAYIVVKLDYETKLILPFETGFTFLQIWATGIEIHAEYNKPINIRKVKKELTISFMSELEFNQIKMSSLLETPP